jgi:hypothetical protein
VGRKKGDKVLDVPSHHYAFSSTTASFREPQAPGKNGQKGDSLSERLMRVWVLFVLRVPVLQVGMIVRDRPWGLLAQP